MDWDMRNLVFLGKYSLYLDDCEFVIINRESVCRVAGHIDQSEAISIVVSVSERQDTKDFHTFCLA